MGLGVLVLIWVLIMNLRISQILCFLNYLYIDSNFDTHSQICHILNFDSPKTFLVLLENTDEKKPDWWFFGSFAEISVDHNNIGFDMKDSYYPSSIKNTRVDLPTRFDNIMWHHSIGFLGANMIWFTAIDGKNISGIYSKTFDKKVDWLIFIKKPIFQDFLPDFDALSSEREFVNANIDQIRWINTWNKKELYFSWVYSMFGSKRKKFKIWINLLSHLARSIDKWYIRLYLADADDHINAELAKNNLFVEPSQSKIFFYNYNLGFNKADKFVFSDHQILDVSWSMISDIWSGEILDISAKNIWHDFTIRLGYKINMPSNYMSLIEGFVKKYNVTLTDKEETILGLNTNFYNRGLIYLPNFPNLTFLASNGDCFNVKFFKTDFGYWLVYDLVSKINWAKLYCQITFSKD